MSKIPLPDDWNDQGDMSWLAADDPRRYVDGGRRCALTASGWLQNWWIGTSPRNGDNASVEGAWRDWVKLARGIIAAHNTAVEKGFCDSDGNPLRLPAEGGDSGE